MTTSFSVTPGVFWATAGAVDASTTAIARTRAFGFMRVSS
jgi:hypothetical protein